jgi:hypothetical protein
MFKMLKRIGINVCPGGFTNCTCLIMDVMAKTNKKINSKVLNSRPCKSVFSNNSFKSIFYTLFDHSFLLVVNISN